MGRAALPDGHGLLLRRTSSIHMMFMRFPIDAIFLDDAGRVVAVRERLRPWVGFAAASAAAVLELPAGTAARHGLRMGDQLRIHMNT